MRRSLHLTALFLPLVVGVAAGSDDAQFFTNTIEPILRRRCYDCHSHAARELNGGLTLDSRSGWEQGGDSGPAIVPGEPDKSLLLQMISWSDPDHQMPPDEKLPDDEARNLRDWIQRGAHDPRVTAPVARDDWWSLQPLLATTPPADGHPIDAFVADTLAANGITGNHTADRRTLIRRATFDLHGLPPTPEAVDAFVESDDPDAWDRLIDELLASPRYGERWARHWLDTVHYADSHGFEHDEFRPTSWKYRDYVIESFNRDLPWSDFVRQQLAADVFHPDQPELTPALGFLGAGPYDRSAAGTAPMSFEYLDRDDLVTQTMAAFVSTTANCARCHAHKFDPITQEDYFALQAVFAGVSKGEIVYDRDAQTVSARRQLTALRAAADQNDADVLLHPDHAGIIRDWLATSSSEVAWQPLRAETFLSADGAILERQADDSIRSSGPRPDKETIVLTLLPPADPTQLTALRLELLPDDSLPMQGPGRNDNGNVHVTELELQVFRDGQSQAEKIALTNATSDFDQTGFPVTTLIDGNLTTSWAIHPAVGQVHTAVCTMSSPLTVTAADRIVVTLRALQGGGHLLGRFRLSMTTAPPASAGVLPALVQSAIRKPTDQRTPNETLAIAAHAVRQHADRELAALPPRESVWAAGKVAKNERGELTLTEPRPVHVLRRGELDKPLTPASPGALSAVDCLPSRFALANPHDESARRAALATWIADPQNPLTWRSIVNRVWHYHFGRGLSDSPSDLGRMGGKPSHPELLDWLAVWFRDEARGSLKQLHRLILTSRTWQQAATFNSAAAAADPDNHLLWRMNRARLDADSYRDAVLFVSGRLDFRPGGPGDQHFTTTPGPQVTPVLHYDNFDLTSPAASRRSIYRLVVRGINDPFMEALDFPDLGLLAPVRTSSASALQSLALFNNRFVLHHSQLFANRLQQSELDPPSQIRLLFQLALQRTPTADESEDFRSLAAQHGLAAACRVMLNSSEFLFVE